MGAKRESNQEQTASSRYYIHFNENREKCQVYVCAFLTIYTPEKKLALVHLFLLLLTVFKCLFRRVCVCGVVLQKKKKSENVKNIFLHDKRLK